MAGLPVTIRLLDPPLHEFLPDRFELHEQIVRGADRATARELAELERELERVRALEETNPMLGTRGVRLGIAAPGDLRDAGAGDRRAPRARSASAPAARRSVEIMIPLVAYERELELVARPRASRSPSEEGFATVATSASGR